MTLNEDHFPSRGRILGIENQAPLLSDLIAPELIEASLRGFVTLHPGVFSGIIQADGRIFPEKEEERQELFSQFCTLIRSTEKGREWCRLSDLHGLQLLETSYASNESREPTRYSCHAGNTELLAPIVLDIAGSRGRNRGVIIGGFWAGQMCTRAQLIQAEDQLYQLGDRLGITPSNLVKAREDSAALLVEENIERISGYLTRWSSALSSTASSLFRLQQDNLVNGLLGSVSAAMRQGMAKATRQQTARPPVQLLSGFLQPIMKDIRDALGLDAIDIWRVSKTNDVIHQFAGTTLMGPKALAIRPFSDGRLEINESGVCDCNSERWSVSQMHCLDAIFRNANSLVKSRSVALFRDSTRAGLIIMTAFESSDKRWNISETTTGADLVIQRALVSLLEGVMDRVNTDLDTLVLLEDERTRLEELQERDRRTHKLVISMAHLVSRPIFEIELAAGNFQKAPSSSRVHLNACLDELRRAANTFQAFKFVTQRYESALHGAAKTEQVSCNVIEALNKSFSNLRAVSHLKRVSIPEEKDVQELAKRVGCVDAVCSITERNLQEVFENVIHNAIKYSLGGRPVEVDLARNSAGVVVLITNYGCGVHVDDTKDIFKLEYRGKHSQQLDVEGSGIGLWVVQELLRFIGGEICLWTNSFFDEVTWRRRVFKRFKTVFRIVLPVRR